VTEEFTRSIEVEQFGSPQDLEYAEWWILRGAQGAITLPFYYSPKRRPHNGTLGSHMFAPRDEDDRELPCDVLEGGTCFGQVRGPEISPLLSDEELWAELQSWYRYMIEGVEN
jgi:hypothetical protein